MKIIITICCIVLSINSYAQQNIENKNDPALKEFINSWKNSSINEKGDTVIFFINKSRKYGYYFPFAEEIDVRCCWKKSKGKIIFHEDGTAKFEYVIKSWSNKKIVLYPEINSHIELILSK